METETKSIEATPEQASPGGGKPNSAADPGVTPGNEVVCTKDTWPDPAVLDRLFNGAPAQDLITYALKELAPGRAAVVSSFGADSAVLLHIVSKIAPDTPVIFLETGKHFPETLEFRDRLVKQLGLTNVRSVAPDAARLAALDADGDLNARDADLCCAIRKEEPLEQALAGFDVWLTGRRRHQTASRGEMPLVERDGKRLKVNPLAQWDASEISAYRTIHELPAHPLVARGYLSIGCAPCTSPVSENEDARAGRWRGSDKTECGIHISRNGETVRIISRNESPTDRHDMSDAIDIWTRDGFAQDRWQRVGDEDELPEGGPVLVSATRWNELRGRNTLEDWEIGVELTPDEQLEDIVPDLDRISMVALDFPAFTDGRAYSSARLLRERHDFDGEVRATGDILLDQIPFMLRCGFSSFAISHGPTRRALADGHLPEVPIYLQPVGRQDEGPLGTRPWMRTRT